jgi:hypothetical protein
MAEVVRTMAVKIATVPDVGIPAVATRPNTRRAPKAKELVRAQLIARLEARLRVTDTVPVLRLLAQAVMLQALLQRKILRLDRPAETRIDPHSRVLGQRAEAHQVAVLELGVL